MRLCNMKHEELTHKIIGCAMKVHSILKSGFQELVYQKALSIEFGIEGLSYIQEKKMTIFYKQIEVGRRRVDFLVEDFIMLELKAVSKIDDLHIAQALNYCEAYNLPLGLLINFGNKSLEFKRVYNQHHFENKDYVKPT